VPTTTLARPSQKWPIAIFSEVASAWDIDQRRLHEAAARMRPQTASAAEKDRRRAAS
jgi:hypothetical protein